LPLCLMISTDLLRRFLASAAASVWRLDSVTWPWQPGDEYDRPW